MEINIISKILKKELLCKDFIIESDPFKITLTVKLTSIRRCGPYYLEKPVNLENLLHFADKVNDKILDALERMVRSDIDTDWEC